MGKHGDTSGPQLPRSPLLALASAAKSAHPPALATTAASLGSSLLHLKAPWRTPCRCPPVLAWDYAAGTAGLQLRPRGLHTSACPPQAEAFPYQNQSVSLGEATSSNAWASVQGNRDREIHQGNMSAATKHHTFPVTDPEEMKIKEQNNCYSDAQRAIKEHRKIMKSGKQYKDKMRSSAKK